MRTDRSRVVVGIDGSDSAIQAAVWAVGEARSRQAQLRLVYAFSGVRPATALRQFGDVVLPEIGVLRAAAETVLDEAAARLAIVAQGVEISTHADDGDAAAVLVDEARDAATVVLGSRHLGALGSVLLGSVATNVSAHAECPIVVVRGPATPREEGSAVVVGVQADENSAAAINYAFDYASRNGVRLHAVLCWHPDRLAQMSWRPEQPVPPQAQAWLSEALAGWQEKFPDVEVHAAVTREHPIEGLVAASNGQCLLVVGSHNRGALVGTLLGSVSQGVLHHATCPVAIVPPAIVDHPPA
jgi:nucleotide-binding universal stress UspA family protein